MNYSITDDFIGVFDDVFEDELIQKYIDYFEFYIKNVYSFKRDDGFRVNDESIDILTGNFRDSSMRAEYINKHFIDIFFKKIYRLYVEKFKELREIEHQAIFDIKIQKTKPGEGYHVWHCENSKPIFKNRICAFTMYLNDVQEGGETEFLYQHKRIVPKKGRVVIWPAYFTHMHRGNPPLSGDKYIITGWVEHGYI